MMITMQRTDLFSTASLIEVINEKNHSSLCNVGGYIHCNNVKCYEHMHYIWMNLSEELTEAPDNFRSRYVRLLHRARRVATLAAKSSLPVESTCTDKAVT